MDNYSFWISLLFFLLNISAVENIQSKIHDMSDIVRITTSLIIIFWQWIGISVEGAGGEQWSWRGETGGSIGHWPSNLWCCWWGTLCGCSRLPRGTSRSYPIPSLVAARPIKARLSYLLARGLSIWSLFLIKEKKAPTASWPSLHLTFQMNFFVMLITKNGVKWFV